MPGKGHSYPKMAETAQQLTETADALGLPAAPAHDDSDPDADQHRADLLLNDLLGMWDQHVADHHRERIRHHEREAEIHRRILAKYGVSE